MKPKARLEQWFVGSNDNLHGKVYGHPDPEIKDGDEVTTSRVVRFDPETKKAWAETQNTLYELGEPAGLP